MPYERIDLGDAARPVLPADFLAGTDAGGTFGKYSGVVLPHEAPAGLSADEQAALAAYERGYHVRQIVSYTWPNPALGFDWPQWSGVVDGMATSVTPAAKAVGGVISPARSLSMTATRRSMSPMAISRRRPRRRCRNPGSRSRRI